MLRDADRLNFRTSEITDPKVDADGTFTLLASTDAAVGFRTEDGQSYREVLKHDTQAVDHSSCRALLINHDRDQICGAVRSIEFKDGRSFVRVQVDKNAKLRSGMGVLDAVKTGALRGVSIGYGYGDGDYAYDEESRTVTVNKWRLSEITLTPTPRDTAAKVLRSLPASREPERNTDPTPKENVMDKAILALLKKYRDHTEFIAERAEAGDKADAIETAIKAKVEDARLGEQERSRAKELAQLKLRESITIFAESHGLKATPYFDATDLDSATKRMLKDKADAESKRIAGVARFMPGVHEKGDGLGTDVTVTRDAVDKLRDAALDGMLAMANPMVRPATATEDQRAGVEKPYSRAEKDQGMRGARFLDIAQKFAQIEVGDEARSWQRTDIATWAYQQTRFGDGLLSSKRASPNQTVGMFSNLLINVMDKSLNLGFQGIEQITYDQWTRTRMVMDFKTFAGAALTLGNLVQIAEGGTLPEVVAKDAGYTGQLSMYGATLTLSYQAIFDDDLGEFWANLGKAGLIARRTIDRTVYSTLLGASWTNDSTTGQALANSGALDAVRSAFSKKKSPAAQYIGNRPRYLLHPLSLARPAQQALGRLQPPGEQAYLAGAGVRTMVPIEVNYLDDPTITGNSAVNYYVTGDPGIVDTVVVCMLQGMATPQVMEFDAGATVSRKFKIFLPFTTVIPTYTEQPTGLTRVLGVQQGTP